MIRWNRFWLFITISVLFFVYFLMNQGSEKTVTKKLKDPVYHDKLLESIQEFRSTISTVEDPQARMSYWYRISNDPETGTQPVGMRRKEVAFSREVAKKVASLPNFRKTNLSWSSIGPANFGGRTRALAVDWSDQNIYLAGGVTGGLWRSVDRGGTWTRTSDENTIQGVTSLAQVRVPGGESIWYYGTGELVGNSGSVRSITGGVPLRGDGIFRSDDGGVTWTQLNATSDAPPNRFGSQFQYIWNLATTPLGEVNDIFAACYGGILYSDDLGISWNVVLGDSLINLPDSVDLNTIPAPFYTDIQVSEDGRFYATLSNVTNRVNADDNAIISPKGGIYTSSNGIDWLNITPPDFTPFYRRTVIGIDPTDSRRAYFLVESIDGQGIQPQLWYFDGSRAGGLLNRWDNLTENLPKLGGPVGDVEFQGSYNMVIRVHPDDPDAVYLGATNLYRSTDGFQSAENTKWIGGYSPANDISIYPNSHPDQHSIVFLDNARNMLVGHDGGISLTNDNLSDSVTWSFLNNAYITTQYYTLAIDRFGELYAVVGGLQDNGTLLRGINGNSDWTKVLGADGGFCEIAENGSFYFLSTQNARTFQVTLNEDFELTSFSRVDPANGESGAGYLFINPFVIDPLNQHVMYIPGGSDLWRNKNVSQIPRFTNEPTSVNWERFLGLGISEAEQISALGISQEPRGILYAGGTNGNIRRIENAHADDYRITNITDIRRFGGKYINCISVDPRDGNRILVVLSNYNTPSLYYSPDGGESYIDVSGNLEEFPDGSGNGPSVRWADIIPLSGNQELILVGTSTGLWSTNNLDGANTLWQQEGASTIGNSIVTMLKSRLRDGRVFVATHGNGIFESTVSGTEEIPRSIELEGETIVMDAPGPNPFTDQITFHYNIPETGTVRIRIFDLNGSLIRTVIWATQYAGPNEATWDGTKEAGDRVTQGLYLYRLEYADEILSGRIIFGG
jgi:hypothetical protein